MKKILSSLFSVTSVFSVVDVSPPKTLRLSAFAGEIPKFGCGFAALGASWWIEHERLG
jgi:hypothetical protein